MQDQNTTIIVYFQKWSAFLFHEIIGSRIYCDRYSVNCTIGNLNEVFCMIGDFLNLDMQQFLIDRPLPVESYSPHMLSFKIIDRL